MSVKQSPAVSQWVTKFQTAIYPQTSVVDSTTNYVEDLNDSLEIEDLDFGELDISSSSERTKLSTTKNDYEFEDEIPGVISEACTKNNLYILVRVPTNPKKLANRTSAFSQTTPRMSERSSSSNSIVNRSIFPILEEDVANSIQGTPSDRKSRPHKVTCWTKDNEVVKEEFASTTNIICKTNPCLLPNQVPDPNENEEFFCPDNHPSNVRCTNQIELQELKLDPNHFKGPPNVSLKNYGILITPTKMPKSENLLVFQVDTEAEEKKRRGDNDGSSCFQWLRKFFLHRKRKSGLVHAKVYKTYFVKWKKCSGETECSCSKEICAKGHNLRRNTA